MCPDYCHFVFNSRQYEIKILKQTLRSLKSENNKTKKRDDRFKSHREELLLVSYLDESTENKLNGLSCFVNYDSCDTPVRISDYRCLTVIAVYFETQVERAK